MRAEAAALWRAVFGEPPPVEAEGELMLDVILRSAPAADYDRLSSPHLRPSAIARPRAAP
ncbi:hypothetical protein [Phenylobacterium sp.]|uniref:hypothetical protein n=1 Tax=Phenylobacterium sp. TaxID=1871053 RepID=UPI003783B30F